MEWWIVLAAYIAGFVVTCLALGALTRDGIWGIPRDVFVGLELFTFLWPGLVVLGLIIAIPVGLVRLGEKLRDWWEGE